MADFTVSVYPDTSGDLVVNLTQDGANAALSAVDEGGAEKQFGRLLTIEGGHGGHVEAKTSVIAADLGLERQSNQHMLIQGP